MVASFSDMSDTKISVRAVAPTKVIREYAICKAIWIAEKKKVRKIALTSPVYGPPKSPPPLNWSFPPDWASLETTAYFNGDSPDGNPAFDVSEKADACRKAWDWFH
jgi:hypothetical protein